MNLIFLFGPPGVGKYTVGKELAKITGYRLFHNHLTVDLVLPVFDFGTKPFVDIRHDVWMMVFSRAKKERLPGLIFTYQPEPSVPDYFIPDLIRLVEDRRNTIYFTELTCDRETLRERITDPERQRFTKIMDSEVERYFDRDHLIPEAVHRLKYTLDNTDLNPVSAAITITNHFRLPRLEV